MIVLAPKCVRIYTAAEAEARRPFGKRFGRAVWSEGRRRDAPPTLSHIHILQSISAERRDASPMRARRSLPAMARTSGSFAPRANVSCSGIGSGERGHALMGAHSLACLRLLWFHDAKSVVGSYWPDATVNKRNYCRILFYSPSDCEAPTKDIHITIEPWQYRFGNLGEKKKWNVPMLIFD